MKNQRKILSMLLALCVMFSVLTGFTLVTALNANNLSAETVEKASDEKAYYEEAATAVDSSKILCYVDETEFKSKNFARRVPEQEALNTYVFQSSDGTKTVYFLDENVKYIDEDGKTVEKDISLVAKDQGYGITQSDIGLTIPNNPNDGISLSYFGKIVTITPTGAKTVAVAEKKDNSVVYQGIFGANTALRYTPLLSGVKEDIILSAYVPNASYSFTIKTDGLNLYNNENGCYLGKDADAVLFNLGDIIVYDAVGKLSDGSISVTTIKAGTEYIVTVSVDNDFLSDPTTVYPVTIDPSITVSDNTHGAGAIEDAPIFAGYATRNFGTYLYNRMGTPSANYGIGRTVVKLSGLINSHAYQSITANQITNVSFYAKESSGGNTEYINIHPLTSNTTWTESTVTWNNVGSYSTAVNYGNTMYNGQWTAFNITNLVKAWKNGTYSANAGFIMTNQNEANNKSFCSSEYSTASYRPYVVVTYEPIYEYKYKEDAPIQYTYRTSLNLTAGQTITLSTGKATLYNDVDTVIHLFKSSNPTESTSWGNDDYGSTRYSQLSVEIPTTGTYTLLVRCYSNQTGYCNVYKDGVMLKENALLGGYKLLCLSNVTGTQNFFTANSSGVDTILYVMDNMHRVVAYNDDYNYQNESEVGDFNWGNHSRVHMNMTNAPAYVFVCGFSSSAMGTTDIYSNCRDGFAISGSFPNLKAIDSIIAASNSDLYNCIAWSGGIAHTWINPDLSHPSEILSPWYNSNNITAFNNFYGNNPQRYAGATTYVNTANANESIIDVYSKNGTWTHAAVRTPGNDQPHGYDWESKCGRLQRIFHSRYSLQGTSYGNVSRYYKISNAVSLSELDGLNAVTFESSVASGRTVIQKIKLSDFERETIRNNIECLNDSVTMEFSRLYNKWKESVTNHETIRLSSNSNDFVTLPEYKLLAQLISSNRNAWYLVVDQYLQDGDVFSMTLFNHTIVANNDKTLSLADAVRKANNLISESSLKSDVYIAPTYETNVMCFIKELLNRTDFIVS